MNQLVTSDDMVKAIENAETQLRIADYQANNLARVLIGRLKHVKPYYLKKLKKELQGFNSRTGEFRK